MFQFGKLAFLSGLERRVIAEGIMIRVVCVVKVRNRDMFCFISVHLRAFLGSGGLLYSLLAEVVPSVLSRHVHCGISFHLLLLC